MAILLPRKLLTARSAKVKTKALLLVVTMLHSVITA